MILLFRETALLALAVTARGTGLHPAAFPEFVTTRLTLGPCILRRVIHRFLCTHPPKAAL